MRAKGTTDHWALHAPALPFHTGYSAWVEKTYIRDGWLCSEKGDILLWDSREDALKGAIGAAMMYGRAFEPKRKETI